MTNVNFNSIEQYKEIKPLFQHFEWHQKAVEKASIPGGNYADLAGMVRDVTNGCATILELINDDLLRESLDEQPLLNKSDISNLARLAMHSLTNLNNIATEGLDWAYEFHTPEGKAERVARRGK